MHHFVQLSHSNGDLSTETKSLLPAPKSLLDLSKRLPDLGNTLPRAAVVGSCRQSSFSSFPLSATTISNSMAACNSNHWVGVPPVHPGGLPLCFANLLSNSQTVGDHELSFCTLFQTIKKSPNSKLLSTPFPLKTRRPLPLWTETNAHKGD